MGGLTILKKGLIYLKEQIKKYEKPYFTDK